MPHRFLIIYLYNFLQVMTVSHSPPVGVMICKNIDRPPLISLVLALGILIVKYHNCLFLPRLPGEFLYTDNSDCKVSLSIWEVYRLSSEASHSAITVASIVVPIRRMCVLRKAMIL
ncbi:hypothetical protein CW304_10855 [Bacillus sp. UFRGS-B20]|nr:hypothetical protein CW304_10855 [Bacillus sp. UFRGS-B20]